MKVVIVFNELIRFICDPYNFFSFIERLACESRTFFLLLKVKNMKKEEKKEKRNNKNKSKSRSKSKSGRMGEIEYIDERGN